MVFFALWAFILVNVSINANRAVTVRLEAEYRKYFGMALDSLMSQGEVVPDSFDIRILEKPIPTQYALFLLAWFGVSLQHLTFHIKIEATRFGNFSDVSRSLS